MGAVGKDVSNSLLTDGQFTCAYDDIPAIHADIEGQLRRAGVVSRDVVSFTCTNTLPHALTLLYFVEHRGNVLVESPLKTGLASGQTRRPPLFCRYAVSLPQGEAGSCNPGPVPLTAANFPRLHVARNHDWNNLRDETGSRVYLPTSGSTGRSKLAAHRPDCLRGNVANCVDRFALRSDDRVAIPVPIGHMYGLGAAFLPAVAARASIDLQSDSNAIIFLTRERQFRPSVAFLTPSFCESLLRLKRDPARGRLTVTAGDRLAAESYQRYEDRFGLTVNLYGSTEMGAIATSLVCDPIELRSRTTGMLMPGVELCGPAASRDTKSVSELCVRHRFGFDGYVDELGQPVVPDGGQTGDCFRTRDLARLWPSGHIEVVGRVDHCVNRDGRLVLGSDIERALGQIEGIQSVAVVIHGTTPRGAGLYAFCVPQPGCTLSASDVRRRGRRLVASHALPDEVLMVGSLPMLKNGKVDRQRLSGMVAGRAAD